MKKAATKKTVSTATKRKVATKKVAIKKKPAAKKRAGFGLDDLTVPQIAFTFLLELVALYIFASLAIDSGSMWQYAISIVLLIAAGQSFSTLVRHLLKKNVKKTAARSRRTA